MCRDLLGQWIKLSLHLRGYSLEAEPVWFGLLCFRHGLQSCQGTSVHFPFPQLSWHLFETPIQINEFLLLPLSYNLIVCSWWSPHFKCDFLKLINCITGLWFSFCMAWTLWFFWPRNKKTYSSAWSLSAVYYFKVPGRHFFPRSANTCRFW